MKTLLILCLLTVLGVAADEPMEGVIQGRKTLKLEHTKTLLLTSREGGVLRLRVSAPASMKMDEIERHAVARFDWEYERSSDQFRTNGAGVYAENYSIKKESDGSYKLSDVGSNLLFKQGEFVIQWSYCSMNQSWFYYNSNKFSHRIVVSDPKTK